MIDQAGRAMEGLNQVAAKAGSVRVRALVIEKEKGWVAQCLEHDIVAQAPTFPDLLKEVERLLVSHVAVSLELNREPFAGIGPAPQVYFEAFERVRWQVGKSPTSDVDEAAEISPQLRIIHERELATA